MSDCHCGQCNESGVPGAAVLQAFLTFLLSSSKVLHLAFVPSYEGVEMPEKQSAIGAPLVYVDVLSDHPATSMTMDDVGISISINRSHLGAKVKIPWEALAVVANDFGFNWKNDALLLAMQNVPTSKKDKDKYCH
jgi:hypothetical protein